jgi:RNA polymerase sigma factor (sigma-70 family)
MTQNEYNTCVINYSDGLFRFILKSNGHHDDAKDIVQMAYEVLWIKCNEVEFEKAKSFLFTVGYRKMIDLIRKRKNVTLKDEIPIHWGGVTATQPIDLKHILNKALDELPAIQKQLVLLKDYEGYTYDEMAQITNISESQVKVYLFRARASLKKTLISVESNI